MKITLLNEKTGVHLTLKSKGELDAQDVMDAYKLVSRESYDETIGKAAAFNSSRKEASHAVDALMYAVKYFTKESGIDARNVNKTTDPLEPKKDVPKQEVMSRPKAIEMIGSERKLSTAIGELAEFKWVDVRVDCPVCAYEGETSTRRGNSYSKCPSCDSKLFNAWATGKPEEQDEDGYEYHANEEIRPKSEG